MSTCWDEENVLGDYFEERTNLSVAKEMNFRHVYWVEGAEQRQTKESDKHCKKIFVLEDELEFSQSQ